MKDYYDYILQCMSCCSHLLQTVPVSFHFPVSKQIMSILRCKIYAYSTEVPNYILFNENLTDECIKESLVKDMKVYEDFISDEEEKLMYEELEPLMKRLRYERNHWDGAIEWYREIEKLHWNSGSKEIIDKVKNIAFESDSKPMRFVHVLDLKQEGVIKPHVDSVKFCGNTIAGISMLSHSVMRLRIDKERHKYADVLLKRKSLYVMKGDARYKFTHEILGNNESIFGSKLMQKCRRISVICRNEP